MKDKPEKPRINVAVEPDLHHKVKVKAVKQKRTITQIVVGLLNKWV